MSPGGGASGWLQGPTEGPPPPPLPFPHSAFLLPSALDSLSLRHSQTLSPTQAAGAQGAPRAGPEQLLCLGSRWEACFLSASVACGPEACPCSLLFAGPQPASSPAGWEGRTPLAAGGGTPEPRSISIAALLVGVGCAPCPEGSFLRRTGPGGKGGSWGCRRQGAGQSR